MIPKPPILDPTSSQIEQLREGFFKRLDQEGCPIPDGFHPSDIERIKTTDLWLQRFLEHNDFDHKASMNMLWDTCKWRKEFGTNDLSVDNLNMEYMNAGLYFPRNRDIDGKVILIMKSKLHIRGLRNTEQLIRGFIYWIERLNREENYQLSVFFDLATTGLSNLDLDYTKQLVNLLKYYYPNNINYIFVFELPWVLTAAFKIIKSLLPPKAVEALRFVNAKNLSDYITSDNMLTSWGGNDDYEFEFVPEATVSDSGAHQQDHNGVTIDENANTIAPVKKVHFANTNSAIDAPMSDSSFVYGGKNTDNTNATMLRITPPEIIRFSKIDDEFIGAVDILNIVKYPITYKIKTTSPEKFRVRPSTGILAPGTSITINVVLQSGPDTLHLSKDKFLVMCMEMADVNASQQDIADIWKNTQNNSLSVEQHRLKCNIAGTNMNLTVNSSVNPMDISKINTVFPGNGAMGMDPDRQWLHVTNSISQLVENTRRLESRIKFNQKLQWITVFVFLLLSIAIVYILKIEINNNSSEHCLKSVRGHYK